METTSPDSVGLSRRLLLAVGGMVLLGGCAVTDSVRPRSPAGPSRPSPGPVRPVTDRRQAPAQHHEVSHHDRGSGAVEQPMRYIHGRRAIALTIDDGPSPVYTRRS